MTDRSPDPKQPLAEPLTRREREILGLLAQGLSGPEIAEKLTLAKSSVKWHIQQLYGKLGVNTKEQAILRAQELGLLGSASPAPTSDIKSAPRNNLPLQVTHFFGREAEISQLKARLSENRLVTLTGSGGVGKTRLSLATAEALLSHFADGVWLVELAPLSDPALVPQQVVASLGLRDEPGQPIIETLTDFLRTRHVLLVLDNCEHLLEACGRLADALLRACPGVRLLASSREPLGVAGEAIFSVPSLAFPDSEHLPPVDQMTDFTAISLFLDRARLALPDYQVAAHNAAALARICQRLDGIPLAIEMAAARLSILNADQLAGRLDDAFRVLTGGSRSALPRQQTLRATIDWSYQLLSNPERQLLQRLSVFAGGCTLEAAESVGAGAGIEPADMLDLLASLAAKSIITADRKPGEEPRYRLLETVRQYAREKLNDSGESVSLHTRHRDYFVLFVETNIPKQVSNERLIWTRRLKAERDNLRQALAWSFSDRYDFEAGPRLVTAMSLYYPGISYQETMNWLTKGVAWCQDHADISPGVYAALLRQAAPAVSLDDPPTAFTWLTQAVQLSRGLGSAGRKTLMWNLFALGSQYVQQRDEAEPAVALLAEADAILLELGPDGALPYSLPFVKARFTKEKAALANNQGRYHDAQSLAIESIRLFDESGDHWSSMTGQVELGTSYLNLGEYALAQESFLGALALVEEADDAFKAHVLRWLALVDWRQGQLARGLDYGRASLREAAQLIDYNIIASCLGICAGIAARQGQPARAARLSGASAALWKKQSRKPWEDSSLDTILAGWQDSADAQVIFAAFETGQAMTADQAMAYVLSDLEP